MSDNIPPIEIQMEIIKKVSGVKSLVRFRSVSKPWKSFIDSSRFIKGYGARHTHPHSHILSLTSDSEEDYYRCICLVEDDKETFKVQEQQFAPFVLSPMLKHYYLLYVVGACHGLQCMYGFHVGYNNRMLVIWNPSIGKSFGIIAPPFGSLQTRYAFGVCPVTKDPTVVKIIETHNKPWLVEVFTLSSRAWNVIPSANLPRESIRLDDLKNHVVIDRYIYWGACEKIIKDNGEYTIKRMLVLFDMITKEFKVVDLPDSLTNQIHGRVSVSKLRECLVVYGSINFEGAECCGVWVMERDSSFRKLFTIGTVISYILGFRKSGEPIFEAVKELGVSTIDVIDDNAPCSQHIKTLRIDGVNGIFFMESYKESLLLLNHSDSCIYY